jgi:hypothetical protein
LSRLSKDQDVLDNLLTSTMGQVSICLVKTPKSVCLYLDQFLYSFGSVFGVIVLIFLTFPPLGVIFLPIAILYYIVSVYYRRSSVETQRLDSLLRSALYSSYSGASVQRIRMHHGLTHSFRNTDRSDNHPCVSRAGMHSARSDPSCDRSLCLGSHRQKHREALRRAKQGDLCHDRHPTMVVVEAGPARERLDSRHRPVRCWAPKFDHSIFRKSLESIGMR